MRLERLCGFFRSDESLDLALEAERPGCHSGWTGEIIRALAGLLLKPPPKIASDVLSDEVRR